MRISQLGFIGVILVTPTLAEASDRAPLDVRSHVEQASVVMVASLVSAEELTANGVDYGRGVLRVERVFYPVELHADRLLLRWTNNTWSSHSRVDPRVFKGQPSLWFVRLQADGTVRMIDRESTIPLCQVDTIEQFASHLRSLYGNGYDDKVLALEAVTSALRPVYPEGNIEKQASPPVVHEKMDFALRDYDSYQEFKAFAIAIDAAGKWVYGYTHELPTEELAAERALLECSARAAKTKVNAACHLYAVGDKVVW